MNPARWQTLEDLFNRTIEKPPTDRAAFAREACGNDTALWDELRRMLDADALTHDPAGGVIASATAAWLEPERPDRAGPYRLERQLGAGGMGTVYLAVRDDGQFEKQAAVKLLRADLGVPGARERFRQERQILAGLEHPNIARLLDGGETDRGQPFLAMEYVDGVPLREYALGLTIRQALGIFLPICAAVAYAHRNLIVHRDLKPANILVTPDGIPKLLDFGIAKLLAPEATGETGSTGFFTPDYASPEQITGAPITTATDVYSLGLVLSEVLTGRRLRDWQGKPLAEMVEAVCHQPPPKPGLGEDLDNIILKAIAADPARRYASVDQLVADIQRFQDGRPVLARRDSVLYRARKFVWRNKYPLAAAVLITAGLTASAAYSRLQAERAAAASALATQQAVEARRQRDIAEERLRRLRTLTEQFLFEFHESIQFLPGATRARKLLLSTAREHLQQLEKESRGDPRITADLARAYQKVADVQGNPGLENLGDLPGAIASYDKAIALWKTLPEKDSAWRRQLMIMESDRAVALSDTQNGEKAISQALNHFNAATDRDREFRRAAGNAYVNRAMIRSGLSNYDAALADTTTAMRLIDNDADLQRALIRHSAVLSRLGRYQEGYDAALRSIAISRRLMVKDPVDTNHQLRLMLAEISAATPHTLRANPARKPELALEHYHRALPIATARAQVDPTNTRTVRDLAGIHTRMAEIYLAQGKNAEALELLGKVKESQERLLRVQPASLDFLDGLARTVDLISAARRSLNQYPEALATSREALDLYAKLAAKERRKVQPETVPALLIRVGDCHAGLGDPSKALAAYQQALAAAKESEQLFQRPLTAVRQFAERRIAGLGKN